MPTDSTFQFGEFLHQVMPGGCLPAKSDEGANDQHAHRNRLPALQEVGGSINTQHKLAWRHVQESGHVLNCLSRGDRLPTSFIPASPPPYMNGEEEYPSWVIECPKGEFTPDRCAEWLEGRLPRPVEDLKKWKAGS